MCFVYMLQSLRDNNLYTGCTKDLYKRVKAHNSGKVKSTQKRKPFKLAYFEECDTLIQARRKEAWLKTYHGGKLKRQLIDDFPKELLDRFNNTRGLVVEQSRNSTGPLAE